jgi:hypothetical protein
MFDVGRRQFITLIAVNVVHVPSVPKFDASISQLVSISPVAAMWLPRQWPNLFSENVDLCKRRDRMNLSAWFGLKCVLGGHYVLIEKVARCHARSARCQCVWPNCTFSIWTVVASFTST